MFAKLVAFHDQHWWLFWTLLMALTVLFSLGMNAATSSLFARRGHQRLTLKSNVSRSGSWAWTLVCLFALRDRYPSLNFLAFLGIYIVISLGGVEIWSLLVVSGDHLLKRMRPGSAQAAGNGR